MRANSVFRPFVLCARKIGNFSSVLDSQLLLETAASPSERNTTGQTPYDIAKLAGNSACARALAAYRRTPKKKPQDDGARSRDVQQDYHAAGEVSDYTAAGASYLDEHGTDDQQYDESGDPSYNSYYGGEDYATDDQYSGYYAEDGSYVDAGGKVYNIADSEGWMRCMTEDGHDYFYNELTEESQWEAPASYVDQENEEYQENAHDYPADNDDTVNEHEQEQEQEQQAETAGGEEEHSVPPSLSAAALHDNRQAAEQRRGGVPQSPNRTRDQGRTMSPAGKTSRSPLRSPAASPGPASRHFNKGQPSPSHSSMQRGQIDTRTTLPAASPTAGAKADSKTYLAAQSNYSPATSPSRQSKNAGQAKQHRDATARTQDPRASLGDQAASSSSQSIGIVRGDRFVAGGSSKSLSVPLVSVCRA